MEIYKYELYEDINLNKYDFQKKSKCKIILENNICKSFYCDNEHKYFYIDKDLYDKSSEDKINIENEYLYKIEFNGLKDENIDLRLYIITCINDEKILDNINLNSYKVISLMDKNQITKLAIRVEGSGNFRIDSIKIYRRKKINFMYTNSIENRFIFNKIDKLSDLKIACIFDKLTESCFDGICNLIKVHPYEWKGELELNRPNILLVESAWHGNDDAWNKKVQYINKYNTLELKNLVDWCKKKFIPTIFWNKEDPVHYNHFINTAKLFDYVFTTDESSVNKYKIDLKHDNIFVLPFAANPKIHNPIKIDLNRCNKACFAGSYYNNKYERRRERLDTILEAAIESIGLDIYDRNYNRNLKQYEYPNKFKENIVGYLPVEKLDKANKGYKVVLNVSTVDNSKTMFSRRIYEVLACGTPIISTYSLGIEELFGDIVMVSDDKQKIKDELSKIEQDNYYYDIKSIKGIRRILENHTYNQRLMYLLDKVSININNINKDICIIGLVKGYEDLKKISENYENQLYKYKKLLLITYSEELYLKLKGSCNFDKNILLLNNKSMNLSLKDIIDSDYISILNPNNYYGKYYLRDLVNATIYTNAEVIGKKSYFKYNKGFILKNNITLNLENEGKDFKYTNLLYLDRSMINRRIIENYTIYELLKYINLNYIDKFEYGFKYFSIDKYNFIENIEDYDSKFCRYVEI